MTYRLALILTLLALGVSACDDAASNSTTNPDATDASTTDTSAMADTTTADTAAVADTNMASDTAGEGLSDQGCTEVSWYEDDDLDGNTTGAPATVQCDAPGPNWIMTASTTPDCDDTNGALNHDDADGDGVSSCDGDCIDHPDEVTAEMTAAGLKPEDVFPTQTEIWYDGVDQNCDGKNDFDQDGDGFVRTGDDLEMGGTATEVGDCADEDIDINPNAIEQCDSGTDEDCNAATTCDDTCLTEFDFGLCDNIGSLPAGPVLHWSYDTVSSNSVTDEGSSTMNGSFTGTPTFAPGLVGDAVTLDGSSWLAAAGALNLPTNSWTLVTWVRAGAANNTGFSFLMTTGNGLPDYTGAALHLQNGLSTGMYTEAGTSSLERLLSGGDLCDDAWHQVALTFSSGIATIWIDGVDTGMVDTGYTDVVWGAQPFAVGNDPNTPSRFFTGQLDETQVYDFAATAADLQTLRLQALCAP